MLGGCPLPVGTRDLRAGRASITPRAISPSAALLCRVPALQQGVTHRCPPCLHCPQTLLPPAQPLCSLPSWGPAARAWGLSSEQGLPGAEQGAAAWPWSTGTSPPSPHIVPGATPAACPALPVVPSSPHAFRLCPCRGTRARSHHTGPGAGRTPSPRGRPCAFVAQRGWAASAWPPAQAGATAAQPSDLAASTPPALPAGSTARAERPALPCLGRPLGPAHLCFPCQQHCGAACVSWVLQHGHNPAARCHQPSCVPAWQSCSLSSPCSRPAVPLLRAWPCRQPERCWGTGQHERHRAAREWCYRTRVAVGAHPIVWAAHGAL